WPRLKGAETVLIAARSQPIGARDAPRDLDRRFPVGLGPERQRFARRRTFEAARQPVFQVWPRRQIHIDRAVDYGGDVDVGDGEIRSEQIRILRYRRIEHLKRRREHSERFVTQCRVAFVRRQPDRMQRPDIDAAIDLGHRPEAPLPEARLVFERGGIERAERIFLGEVERNRQRFRQHELAVDNDRQPPIGIERQEFGAARAGLADLERHVLVGKLQLFGDPQGAKRARAGDAVDAKIHAQASAAATALPQATVFAAPPRSPVRNFGSASTCSIALTIEAAASASPRWSSIIAPDQIWPIGLAMPWPAISGAEPCTGSNTDGNLRSGLMFP